RAPAYPAPAHLERFDLAITGELDTAGSFRTALGRLDGTRVTWGPRSVDLAASTLVVYRDDLPDAIPIAAARDAAGFTLARPIAADPASRVAIVSGLPWLAAQRWSRGY